MIATQQDVFNLISEANGNAGLIVIPKEFLKVTESYEAAAMLAQLVYWTDKSQNDGWIYKTYRDWEEEIAISKHKAIKAKEKLESRNLIQTKVKKANGTPVVHYKVNMEILSKMLQDSIQKNKTKNMSELELKVKKTEMESLKFGKWKVKISENPLTEITNINYKHKLQTKNINKEKPESVNEDLEKPKETEENTENEGSLKPLELSNIEEELGIIRPKYLVTELPREDKVDPKQLEAELQRLIAFYPKKSGNYRRLRDKYRYLRLKKQLRFEEIYEAIDGYILEMDSQEVEQKYWKTLDTLLDPVELDPWLYKPTISIDKKGKKFKGEFCIATRVIRYHVPWLERIETQILPERKVDQMIEEGRLIFLDKENMEEEVKKLCPTN